MNYDLFGNPIEERVLLREQYIEPPFTVLDSKSGNWQKRKKKWRNLGLLGEIGRKATAIHGGTDTYRDIKNKDGYNNRDEYTSIFDPVLCELIYKWFAPKNGTIIDPFAGGSVRGIVANYLGYKYTGIDIRPEQIESNKEQSETILKGFEKPIYYCGDSNIILRQIPKETYDLLFSCPPYTNLEVYSDIEGDISNMEYENFLIAYRSIIKQSCDKVKKGGVCYFCCRRSQR